VRSRSPPGAGRRQDAAQFVVLGHQRVGAGEFAQQRQVVAGVQALGRRAGHQRGDQGAGRAAAVRGFGQREQQVGALGLVRRFADDVQAVGDQRVFEFQHRVVQAGDLRGGGLGRPGGLGGGELQRGSFALDHRGQFVGLAACVGLQAAVTLDQRLQVHQALVEAGLRHRGRQVADQRGGSAAFGDGAFGRVVAGVEVEVGQVADQPVGPAGGRQAVLLAGHELQRPVGAEVQHRVGAEVFTQPAVEGRERMGRCKALLEQQPHRVTLVAEGRLDAHENVAEAFTQHKEVAAVALLPAGGRAPLGLDLLQVFFSAHVVVGADAREDIGLRTEALGIAVDDLLAQRIHTGRQRHGVTLTLHRAQRVVERLEDRQESRGAGVAGVGREVEDHRGDPALGPLGAAQVDQLAQPGSEHVGTLAATVHVVAGRFPRQRAAPAEDHRAGGAVQLGDRDHHGRFHRQQASRRRGPLRQRLELHRGDREVGHVQPGQHVFGRLRVVVGRAADE